jgi:protein-S-isoprenylcysteine O-methyltransferase Ste14
MQPVQLARIAAQAEKLRLQRIVRRQIIRVGCAAVAVLFVLAFFALLHLFAILEIARSTGPATATAIVFAVDLLIAIILGVMAMRSSPDALEVEARQVRDRALAQMKDAVAMAALLGPVGRLFGRRAYRLGLGALAARFLSRKR